MSKNFVEVKVACDKCLDTLGLERHALFFLTFSMGKDIEAKWSDDVFFGRLAPLKCAEAHLEGHEAFHGPLDLLIAFFHRVEIVRLVL